jgi:hypothetical protein
MNLPRFTDLVVHSLAGITLLALSTPAVFAQRARALNVLVRSSAAFSGGYVVQSVLLSVTRLGMREAWKTLGQSL